MMLVQKYLMFKSLQELEAEHGVKHRISQHKISLNYDQIEAKDSDPLAQECRGLILTPVQGSIVTEAPLGETRILARPFDRFFNLGQEAAVPVGLDHPETRFYEKMDGCFLYNTKVNCWDGSTIKIGDIVSKNLSPTLIGMDENGNFPIRTQGFRY